MDAGRTAYALEELLVEEVRVGHRVPPRDVARTGPASEPARLVDRRQPVSRAHWILDRISGWVIGARFTVDLVLAGWSCLRAWVVPSNTP
jgi:hypothetical protein